MTPTCTCSGDRWPDGSRVVTVGCRVHHLMADGAPAADHEVGCESCREFFDNRSGECRWYDQIDPDMPEEERGETFCCQECGEFGVEQGTLRLKP